jgi:hypothetical protein
MPDARCREGDLVVSASFRPVFLKASADQALKPASIKPLLDVLLFSLLGSLTGLQCLR